MVRNVWYLFNYTVGEQVSEQGKFKEIKCLIKMYLKVKNIQNQILTTRDNRERFT